MKAEDTSGWPKPQMLNYRTLDLRFGLLATGAHDDTLSVTPCFARSSFFVFFQVLQKGQLFLLAFDCPRKYSQMFDLLIDFVIGHEPFSIRAACAAVERRLLRPLPRVHSRKWWRRPDSNRWRLWFSGPRAAT
jgi:hypothetical protein